jgi:anti-sigma regulatory factor (Ser/Thr protein kinase)
MTRPSTTRIEVVPARLDAFSRLGSFLEEVAGAAGLSPEAGLRLRLVVEELFTNTVVHGHGGDCDAPVTVSAEPGNGRIDVVYEDSAPPFDPFAARGSPDHSAGGGHGIALVAGLTDAVSYTRVGDRNRIALVLRAPGGGRT